MDSEISMFQIAIKSFLLWNCKNCWPCEYISFKKVFLWRKELFFRHFQDSSILIIFYSERGKLLRCRMTKKITLSLSLSPSLPLSNSLTLSLSLFLSFSLSLYLSSITLSLFFFLSFFLSLPLSLSLFPSFSFSVSPSTYLFISLSHTHTHSFLVFRPPFPHPSGG